jgi:group I intron endonuclease
MPSVPHTTASVIYQIRCVPTDKVYVGSAVNMRNRAHKHRSDLRLGKHHSVYLQRAWKKYGAHAFIFEVLEVVQNAVDLVAREQVWIDLKRSTNRRYGYNICAVAGSALGVKHTPEAKARMSVASRAHQGTTEAREYRRVLMTERMKNPEALARVVAATHTPEARARRSATLKALWDDPASRNQQREVMTAIRNTPEVLAQQSEITKAMWQDPEWKERQRAAITAGLRTPDALERRSELSTAMWADPEWKARQLAKIKAGHDRRKQRARES